MKRKIILKLIASSLEQSLKNKDISLYSLLGGDLGIVYCLSKLSQTENININCDEYLEKIISSIQINPIVHSYCNGLSGLAYTLTLLQEENVLRGVHENLYTLDEEIYNWFHTSLNIHNIDPLHGAVGALYYFSKRSKYNSYFSNIVLKEWLEYLSINKSLTEDGMTMKFERYNGPSPYNLSLSHGLSGVIVTTIDALKFIDNSTHTNAKRMLEEFGEFLINILKFNHRNFSCFPSFYYLDRINKRNSRLAWCYGDLGIALALYKLGMYLNSERYIYASQKVVLHASKRRLNEDTLINDRCVCHGSCGVYSLFNFFNVNLFNGELTKTVNFWYDFTYKDVLEQPYSFKEKLAYYDNTKNKYVLKYGILEGIAGICLGLLDQSKSLNRLIFIQ
ncbi:MAG: hypothetical protein K2K98_13830 [Muribaculaceae bacterium]|nr:hypothetical protein [Muribaculaceae bacterium]